MRPQLCILLVLIAFFHQPSPGWAGATAAFPSSVASGDPREDQVILWTQVLDLETPVRLIVTTDGDQTIIGTTAALTGQSLFPTDELLPTERHDGCVKVRVTGLSPESFYYYQFVQGEERSPIGRTKTASSTAEKVCLAYLHSTAAEGQFLNGLTHLANSEIVTVDAVIHLGNYIGEHDRLDASTLDDYRGLYRAVHADAAMIRVHERFPMICQWNDGEFIADHWQDTAVVDGKEEPSSIERKHVAEQAWLEYLPTELGLSDDGLGLSINDRDLFPNLVVYRDFNFGSLAKLLLMDTRSFRPDHLVPEDAFPGTVILDQDTLESLGTDSTESMLDPYVDIDLPAYNDPNAALDGASIREFVEATISERADTHYAERVVRGFLSMPYLNELAESEGLDPLFSNAVLSQAPRGLTYAGLGKVELFASRGVREQVNQSALALLDQFHGNRTLLGAVQDEWLKDALEATDTTWTFVGSPDSFAPVAGAFGDLPKGVILPRQAMVSDEAVEVTFPERALDRFLVSAHGWAGQPTASRMMLEMLASHGAVVLSGGELGAHNQLSEVHGVIEMAAAPSVGNVYRDQLDTWVSRVEAQLAAEFVAPFRFEPVTRDRFLHQTAQILKQSTPLLDYINATDCGYTVVTMTQDSLRFEHRLIDASLAKRNLYDDRDLDAMVRRGIRTIAKGESAIPVFTPADGVILNEFLPNPSSGVDVNGDGEYSSLEEEFIELINPSAEAVELTGWTVWTTASGESLRHEFPTGTVLLPGRSLILYGGALELPSHPSATVQLSSTGGLRLRDLGDQILLKDAIGQEQWRVSYGAEAIEGQSLTRSPEITGTSFQPHQQVLGSSGNFSPGNQVSGEAFSETPLPSTKRQLTIAINPTTGGRATGAGSHEDGTSVSVSATPNPGFTFAGWTGGGIANASLTNTTVTMNSDQTITANFTAIPPLALTTSVEPSNAGATTGDGFYHLGATVSIRAEPNTGFRFLGWSGDGIEDSSLPETTVTMQSARVVTAQFIRVWALTLSSSPAEGGSVSGGGLVDDQSRASLVAEPADGFVFLHWVGDGIADPESAETTVTVTSDRNVVAVFGLASQDRDGDGVLDAWEEANGLDSTDQEDAKSDRDQDGRTALAEFHAQTDPNDASSALTIQFVRQTEAFTWSVGWSSVEGVTYSIEEANTLSQAADWKSVLKVTATGMNTIIELPRNTTQSFVRVVASRNFEKN